MPIPYAGDSGGYGYAEGSLVDRNFRNKTQTGEETPKTEAEADPDLILDLIDMDLQNDEIDVVPQYLDLFRCCVRRIHIGTHARHTHYALRRLLASTAGGFLVESDFPNASLSETPFGPTVFRDGVLTLVNARFALPAEKSAEALDAVLPGGNSEGFPRYVAEADEALMIVSGR